MTLTNLPMPSYTGADLSARVNAIAAEARAARRLSSVAALLADTTLGYSGARAVAAGDTIEAGSHRYTVAASTATDNHLATAGGVRLHVRPGPGRVVDLDAWGLDGTGTTDDIGAFRAARDLCLSLGGGTMRVPAGRYRITRPYQHYGSVHLDTEPGVTFLADISTGSPDGLNMARPVLFMPDIAATFTIDATGGLLSGQRTFTLTTAPTGLAVGELVWLTAGTDPNDANEEMTRWFAHITAISGNAVTVNLGIPERLPSDAVSSARNRLYKLAQAPLQDVTVGAFAVEVTSGYQTRASLPELVYVMRCYRTRFEGFRLPQSFTGIGVMLIESEECTIGTIEAARVLGTSGSSGRLLSSWGTRNCEVDRVSGYSQRVNIFLESQGRDLRINAVRARTEGNNGNSANLFAIGGHNASLGVVELSSDSIENVNDTLTGATNRIRRLIVPTQFANLRLADVDEAVLDFDPNTLARASAPIGLRRIRQARATLTLGPNLTDAPLVLGLGYVRSLAVRIVGGSTGVTALKFGSGEGTGPEGGTVDLSLPIPGAAFTHYESTGVVAVGRDWSANKRNTSKALRISTGATTSSAQVLEAVYELFVA